MPRVSPSVRPSVCLSVCCPVQDIRSSVRAAGSKNSIFSRNRMSQLLHVYLAASFFQQQNRRRTVLTRTYLGLNKRLVEVVGYHPWRLSPPRILTCWVRDISARQITGHAKTNGWTASRKWVFQCVDRTASPCMHFTFRVQENPGWKSQLSLALLLEQRPLLILAFVFMPPALSDAFVWRLTSV